MTNLCNTLAGYIILYYIINRLKEETLREKCLNTEFFFGPYFQVFGLNMEIYKVSLRIHSKYGKISITENSLFGHFLNSDLKLCKSL